MAPNYRALYDSYMEYANDPQYIDANRAGARRQAQTILDALAVMGHSLNGPREAEREERRRRGGSIRLHPMHMASSDSNGRQEVYDEIMHRLGSGRANS